MPNCATDANLWNTGSPGAPFLRRPRRRRRNKKPKENQYPDHPAGTTMASKVVTTTNQVTATMNAVNAHTSADYVEVPSLSASVVDAKTVKCPLNVDELKKGLKSHPDRQFVDKVINYAKHGVPLGYIGTRESRCYDSWPSAYKYIDVVYESIQRDVQLGRKMGPYSHPPDFMRNYRASPLGAFPKKHSKNKFRIIHDLSWPPGQAVNDCIPAEDGKVKYICLDDITKIVKRMGPNTLLSKLDLKDAFKTIPVRPEDWELLGSMLYIQDNEGGLVPQFYYETVLPFGCRSSAKLFTYFADALQYIMQENGTSICEHYLDDYFTAGAKNSDECAKNLKTMLDTCYMTGFEVNYEKVTEPATVIEYLGIIIDSSKMELRISEQRLTETYNELYNWQDKRSCNKRALLSLIGKLQFISSVVRPGRTFVRRMIDLSKKAKFLHYKLYLNSEFRKDLNWWLKYLQSWNGISMFYEEAWLSNEFLDFYTDSSDVAMGAYYSSSWFIVPFKDKLEHIRNKSINYRELLAIVVAFCTWCRHFKQKRILFHCDNMSVVDIINKGTSKSCEMMELVRTLFFECASNGCELKAVWIDTKSNFLADFLSRLNIDKFKKHCHLNVNEFMTDPVLPHNLFQKGVLQQNGAFGPTKHTNL